MIRSVRARWQGAILVCAKCERKLGNEGFGADRDQRLSKLLRKRSGGGKGRKAELGLVTVPCLKVCPKNAVTIVDGARPREWLIVEAGTPVEAVEQRLGLASTPSIAAE